MNKLIFIALAALVACGEAGEPAVDAGQTEVTDTWPDGTPKREVRTVAGDTVAERQYHPNGSLNQAGSYDAEGRRHGKWVAKYPDGEPWSEHAYDHGVQIGAYRTWYPGGIPHIEGEYDAAGRPAGTWKFYGPDGVLARELPGSEIPN